MSFYRWCMRYGAPILFVISALQLVLGIIFLLQTWSTIPGETGFSGSESGRPMAALFLLQGLISVFTTAALPFFGAVLIYRLDRRGDPRQAEPFE